MLLHNKVALVTGASRGIGRAIALELAKNGADIAVNYASSEGPAREVVSEIEALGRRAIAIRANVSDAQECAALVERTISELGTIDILVNNAGITKDGLLMRMKEEDFDAVINTNLKSTFLMCKAVTRPMMKKSSGRIINISSVVGQMGNAGQANYVASKAGIIGMTKSIAKELSGKNILVNAVTPGFIESDMTAELKDDIRQTMLSHIPLGSFGKPEDVAGAVVFLASGLADYVTGQVIAVNGGMYM
ncbi:3-oxoacyl-[acyl-carrier-protein] reductase [Desulfurispirillum indicum]|uniref:3-oxoacyl-[acyl-carrier-protein] reductase n=1 Tax=Desulfurispirillum indicum TaxID=936456 RepID=UPI001CFAE969|nr:3-oxoacyl-[acyl-carrier-protein] reductase [Desulfurispirillum indicum]UCZ57224.1 3-oxoacyl-[acyl-carrier-protein] reductase [Desulfurispirillum indicum]